jgi:hypothetical protein
MKLGEPTSLDQLQQNTSYETRYSSQVALQVNIDLY